MINQIQKIFTYVVPIIICSSIISCVPSQDIVTILNEPSLKDKNQNKWYLYYRQELSINNGSIIVPGETYPQAANDGYKKAKNEWEQQKISKVLVITVLIGGVVIYLLDLLINEYDKSFPKI